jgi:hypothetical protein
MPTVRTPIKRAVRSRVTDEARAVYARADALQDIYWACLRNEGCGSSASQGEHCAECREFLDLSNQLHGMLGLKPWDECPITTYCAEVPDWMQDPHRIASWRKAWAMRCELQK